MRGKQNDLISRQAAIDAIMHNQEVYSNNFGNDPIDRYTIAIIDNDAQTIAQVPSAQPEQRWIPCEERLPEVTGAYLVACQNGNVKVGHFTTFDGTWTDARATAWMPLPEAYEE